LRFLSFAILRSGFGLKLPNSRRPAGYECPMTLVICTRSSGVNPTNSNPERTLEACRTMATVVHGLSGESEIDGDRVTDMDVTFNDGSQTAFAKIEADASYRPHATAT